MPFATSVCTDCFKQEQCLPEFKDVRTFTNTCHNTVNSVIQLVLQVCTLIYIEHFPFDQAYLTITKNFCVFTATFPRCGWRFRSSSTPSSDEVGRAFHEISRYDKERNIKNQSGQCWIVITDEGDIHTYYHKKITVFRTA